MSVPQTSLGLFSGPPQGATQGSGATGQTGSGSLTTSDFLNLLVTELQNQDPLNPSDSATFMQQMSTLTDVSAIGQMTQSVANLVALSASQSALSLMGQTVSLASGGLAVTGQVSGLQAGANGPELLVNGALYPLSAVTAVGTAAQGVAATGTTGTTGTGGSTP